MNWKARLQGIGKVIGSVFVPKTTRGRVRQAIAFVLALLFVTANLNAPKYWDAAADRANAAFDRVPQLSAVNIPHFWHVPFRLGLDLQGGTHLVYLADTKDVDSSAEDEALAGVRDVIERRVNAFGVSEPLVQTNKAGSQSRVIVDLAGVSDIGEAIKLIGETPILEFKEVNNAPSREMSAAEKKDMAAWNAKAMSRAKEALRKARVAGADFATLAKEYSEDPAVKDKGGDLGFVSGTGSYQTVVGKIENSKLAPGGVVPEITTSFDGQHVVKFEERRDAGSEINASHILICYQSAQGCDKTRSKDEAKKLAEDLKAKALPSNFGVLAKENSDDLGSGAQGGDLGWFKKGAMVAPFEQAVFAIKKGEISGVVETQFGFHIIYKIGERPAYEYHLRDILLKTKTANDYLPPPDPWKNTALSGKHVKRATLQFHAQTGEPQVGLEFNDEGKKLFGDITERNVGKPVAIFLDGQALSEPVVQEPIRDGSAVISGNFTINDAKLLVRRLNAGALPVPIKLESQQSVGASLGQDSLDASLKAGLIGFAAVALFMLLYYRLPGLIAILALLLYSSINLALYKAIPVTLSLSGIAGFILSVGMAVDANILIFERMREELLRGRPLGSAIDEGFRRAWLSIRDSNFTTLISCAILFYTSSSLIKGFAFTLALGVLMSMFSAITVSRTLLRLVGGWKSLQNPTLYLAGWSRLNKEVKE